MTVLVIGAGLLGVATAYFLGRHGCRVTVIDRAPGPGLQTSYANGGMLTPSMSDPWNMTDEPSFRLALERNAQLTSYSLSVMHELRDEIPPAAYHGAATGTLRVFTDRSRLDRAAHVARVLERLGVAHRVVGSTKLAQIEPALGLVAGQFAGGIYSPGDESGDAHLFCTAMASRAERLGVAFRFGESVAGFGVGPGRVEYVDTDRGRYEADAVVIAAGPWSQTVAGMAGIPLPITPCKGYSITLPRGDWPDGPRMPVIDDAMHAAVSPIGDRLRVAGVAEFAGYDLDIPDDRIGRLCGLLTRLYPRAAPLLKDATLHAWTGLRPDTPDGYPIMGPTRFPNLFVNTGHGHLGWTMAAGSGRAMADLIAGKQPSIDLNGYGLARFRL